MKLSFLHLVAGAVLAVFAAGCRPAEEAGPVLPETVDFNFHVKPILSDRCFTCHGPDENQRKADLSLHTPEGLRAALDSLGTRFAIVPGRPDSSVLIHRITSADPDERMPPPESNLSLSDYDIAVLRRWIEQGAEWKPHWAFTPPEKPLLPEVERTDWPRDDLDRFILARLEREGLDPAPEADRAVWLRRVTFDLTGLPPTLDDLDAFLADDGEEAYARVVDRLLASPAYGERMASIWMDVARYADSHGYQDDFERSMWPWRDWVIRAFNDGMPYDEFVTWQLAGDLLPEATLDQRLATGFNRNHPINQEGGIILEEYRVEYVADRTNTLGTAFLGLTLECARCHDHKYDPVSQEEYYQLFAFFNQVPGEHDGKEPGKSRVTGPTVTIPDSQYAAERAFVEGELKRHVDFLEDRRNAPPPAFAEWQAEAAGRYPTLPPYLADGLTAYLPLDFVASDTVADEAAPGRAGFAVQGEPGVVEGRFGQALRPAGDTGVQGRLPEFDPDDGFTWAAWIYYPRRERAPLLAQLDARGRGVAVRLSGEQVIVTLGGGDRALEVITKAGLWLNAWTHVAVVYDGSGTPEGVRVYFDGEHAEEVVLGDALAGSVRTGAPFTVGHNPAASDGGRTDATVVDEVRVYDRPLAEDEVVRLAGYNPVGDLLAIPEAARTPSQARSLYQNFLYAHDAEFRRHYRAHAHWQGRFDQYFARPIWSMTMADMDEPRTTFLLERGLYSAPRDTVHPGTPARLLALDEDLPRNRLGLAQWLFDPAHPLTARVIVNRYWQQFFGRGLVTTPDDFGNQGALPSHPELLDWLAVTFRESGWDTKAFLRRIALSATYRQSSEASNRLRRRDPGNVLLARGPRHRLPAEMVRDQALAASGLLARRVGGPSVRPYQPPGLWAETTSGQGLTRYVDASGEDLYRRSLYTFFKRTVPPPAMIVFDADQRDRCAVRRQRTNTPLQALVLMNDPQLMEAARTLAEQLIREEAAPEDRHARAFRMLTARAPDRSERALLRDLYETELAAFRADPDRAEALLRVGETARDPELDPAEVAAQALVVSAVFNLDETVTKG